MEGRVFGGRYRLISQLGKGGMATVWRAEHTELGTPVAVKLMDSAIAQDPGAMQRFKREAQAAARLRSANVVQIMDYGVEEGTPYIAMELLDGESLADRLDREFALRPSAVARIMSSVAVAVERAHSMGIVHRDLKPDNIFLTKEANQEIVKVLDFGIAKMAGDGLQLTKGAETKTGSMLGTPYYMSPEQIAGNRGVDHRTDIWAMGVIAYECLLSQRPFDGETIVAIGIAICSSRPPLPSTVGQVPPGLDEWFARTVASNPDDRFQSAHEAVETLKRVLPGENEPGDEVIRPALAPGADELPRGGTVVASDNPLAASDSRQAVKNVTASPASVTLNSGGRSNSGVVASAFVFGSLLVATPIAWWVYRSPDTDDSALDDAAAAASELMTTPSAAPTDDPEVLDSPPAETGDALDGDAQDDALSASGGKGSTAGESPPDAEGEPDTAKTATDAQKSADPPKPARPRPPRPRPPRPRPPRPTPQPTPDPPKTEPDSRIGF